jgi:hypothetical protein
MVDIPDPFPYTARAADPFTWARRGTESLTRLAKEDIA